MVREFATVGVVGLGTMGAGIAEVFARSGIRVIGVELDPEALTRGRGYLERSTGRSVTRGRLSSEDQAALLERVTYATELDALADVELVIEAVPERLAVKQSLFRALDDICPSGTVFATNTSSLSITDIAASTARPAQVLGLHFFNPAPVMTLVEIVPSVLTDRDVVDAVRLLAERLGRTAVVVGDRAGFVANRLLFGYLNQAVGMLDSGRATREDIDTAMTVGAGLPMGPLALLDLIGLDTGVQILDTIFTETGDRRYAAAPTLRHLVAAGLLGRKSGRGLYEYATVVDAPAGGERRRTGTLGRVAVIGRGAEADALIARLDLDVVRVEPAKLKPLARCDIVIDAAGGSADEVRTRFGAVGRAARSDTVLITTATTPGVLACAAAAGNPERVVGLRVTVRDPAPGADGAATDRPGLGELVASLVSSASTVAVAAEVADALSLTTVRSGDRAGFILDALLLPHLNDALLMRQDNYASADDIDAAMRLGCGYEHGPFALLDRLSAARVLDGLEAIYAERPEPGLAPASLLRQVAALEAMT